MVKKNKVSIKNVKITEPINLYRCEIGDNCFIGPFVEKQKKFLGQ